MRLGFVSSMAALLAGTGLVMGQAPDYQYVQGGTLPSRSALPAMTGQMPVENSQPAAAATGASSYDCYTGSCGAGGCGAGGCGAGGCASGLCNNTVDLCMPASYSVYGRLDFLIWTIQRSALPAASGLPLGTQLLPVTVNGVNSLVPVNAIVSGDTPGSNSRLGGEHLGTRATVGFWLDSQSHCGVEFSGFILERRTSAIASSAGPQQLSPEEGRIFIPNPNPSAATVLDANFFLTQGSSSVASSISNELWGLELNGRCGRYTIGCFSMGTLAGIRYLDFREDLLSATSATLGFSDGSLVSQTIVPDLGDPIIIPLSDPATVGVPSLTFLSADSIRARNQWLGYQVGGDFEWGSGPIFLNGYAKFGLGNMHQAADVVSVGNAPLINGHYTRNRLAGIMEGSINIGYSLTPAIRTYLGYDYLYMMRVARPNGLTTSSTNGLAVNVAGTDVVFDQAVVPVFRFNDRDMWVQGVHFGMEVRY